MIARMHVLTEAKGMNCRRRKNEGHKKSDEQVGITNRTGSQGTLHVHQFLLILFFLNDVYGPKYWILLIKVELNMKISFNEKDIQKSVHKNNILIK